MTASPLMRENLDSQKDLQKKLNKQFSDLAKASKNIASATPILGTANDTSKFRQQLKENIRIACDVGKEMKHTLRELENSNLAQNQLEKLKDQFDTEIKKLEKYTKEIQQKEREYKPISMATQHEKSALLGSYANQRQYQDQNDNNISNLKQQQSEQFLAQDDTADLEQREEQAYNMLEDLQNLNEMFTDLKDLVYEQDENIQVLSHNVAETKDHVVAGTTHLEKAAEYQKGYRKKMCCLLLIVLIIAGIVVAVVFAKK